MDFSKVQQRKIDIKLAKEEFWKLKESKAGFEEIYEECYKKQPELILDLLNPQAYGILMEKLHIRHFDKDISKVPARKDQGDFQNVYGDHYEYKFTTPNRAGKINFVQIRPWQKVDYVLEVLQPNNILELFYVPKSKMKVLLDKYSGNAHGTKDAVKFNKNIELAIRPLCNERNACWRDLQQYKISESNLRKLYARKM